MSERRTIFGMEVIANPDVPPDMIQFRSADGKRTDSFSFDASGITEHHVAIPERGLFLVPYKRLR